MKTFRCFLVSALVFMSGVAFGDVNPFQETTNTLNSVSQVVAHGLVAGLVIVIMILAASPFVVGAVMGYKAYEHTKQEQDGNPNTAGVKAFLAWFIPVGLVVYYFLGQMLGNQHTSQSYTCNNR